MKPLSTYRIALRAVYERFKSLCFFEQAVRLSNMHFVVYALWNAVRRAVGADPPFVWATMAAIGSALLGIVFGFALVATFTWRRHLVLLPLCAACFATSCAEHALFGVIFIPCLIVLVLGLVRWIIGAANRVNRL